MASPPNIHCPSCKRTHRPPARANCKYAKAAKERCSQLGMREEDYMLYLSDVSEEDPDEMTSETPPPCLIDKEQFNVAKENQRERGSMVHEVQSELIFLREQLAALQSLVTEVISENEKKCKPYKNIQEKKEIIKSQVACVSLGINKVQSLTTAKYLAVSGSSTAASSSKLGTNQEDDVRQLTCHSGNMQENSLGNSDQKEKSLHCSEVSDEGYGSLMPSTCAATVSGVPVSSMHLPNAKEGQISDTSKGHSNATNQHVSETKKSVQARTTVDERGGVVQLAVQDVQIRETEKQNHHVSDPSASEGEFYDGTRQGSHCIGQKEGDEAQDFIEKDADVLGNQSLGCSEQQLNDVISRANARLVGESETQQPKICEVQGKEAEIANQGILVLNREYSHEKEQAVSHGEEVSPHKTNVKTCEGSNVMTEESKMINGMPTQTTTDQRNSVLTTICSDLVCQIPEWDCEEDQPEDSSESNESIQFNKIVMEDKETSVMFESTGTDDATKSSENQVSENIIYTVRSLQKHLTNFIACGIMGMNCFTEDVLRIETCDYSAFCSTHGN